MFGTLQMFFISIFLSLCPARPTCPIRGYLGASLAASLPHKVDPKLAPPPTTTNKNNTHTQKTQKKKSKKKKGYIVQFKFHKPADEAKLRIHNKYNNIILLFKSNPKNEHKNHTFQTNFGKSQKEIGKTVISWP